MTLRVEKNTSSNYFELKSKNDSIQYKSSMLYLPLNNPKSLVARYDGLVLEKNGADVKTENNPEAIYNLFVTLGLKISKPDCIKFLAGANNVTEKEVLASWG